MDGFNAAIRAVGSIAVFLDLDGTLIEFAARPDAVRVPEDLPSHLISAQRRLNGALAIITGRSINDLDHVLGTANLRASGLHGAEYRLSPASPVTAIFPPLSRDVRDLVHRAAAPFPGVLVENKGVSIAVHYRATPQVAAPLGAALAADLPSGLDLLTGEFVYEIKPAGFDKGVAIRHFMASPPFSGRRPVFVSDHPIDQPAFDAATALGGFGVSVGRQIPGTAGHFTGPPAVRAWLRDLAA
jgi:trehalose 6-phosphate phosphatase